MIQLNETIAQKNYQESPLSFTTTTTNAHIPINLNECAVYVNNSINDSRATVILNPKKFIREYKNFLEMPISNPALVMDFKACCLSWQNHYDTTEICRPKIKDGDLIFYVEQNGIPYKVSCNWPIYNLPPKCRQQLLPIIE